MEKGNQTDVYSAVMTDYLQDTSTYSHLSGAILIGP